MAEEISQIPEIMKSQAGGGERRMRTDALFIGVEVDDAVAADAALAAKLEEVCPVDIYARGDGGAWRSSRTTSTSACCAGCASTPLRRAAVRVLKLYDGRRRALTAPPRIRGSTSPAERRSRPACSSCAPFRGRGRNRTSMRADIGKGVRPRHALTGEGSGTLPKAGSPVANPPPAAARAGRTASPGRLGPSPSAPRHESVQNPARC